MTSPSSDATPTPGAGPKLSVAIGVCTYKRQDDLRALLTSLHALRIPDHVAASLIIVDNDSAGSARPLADDFAAAKVMPVTYAIETEAGIPFARNRVLTEAGQTGYLAFVDDDETVDPDWLVELVAVAEETGATFVQGPLVMTVEDTSDTWWLASRFFSQRTYPDRAARHESWTNNVLIDLAFVARHGCAFDPALRFDGGTDTLFFQDIVAAGGEGRYAAKALAYEVQGKSRLTWKWALLRQYRYGVTRANTTRLRDRSPMGLGRCFVRGGGMLCLGLVELASGLVKGRVGVANGMALIARGTGVMSGLLGGRRQEYAR